MGQAASKATEAVKRATTATAPHLSKSQRTRAAAEAEWRRSSDASPSSITNQQQQQQDVEVMPEMPPDLIKFLNDAGPLQRTIDKELTSPKVYDSLMSDDKARDEQRQQANKRVRRKMPIITSPHLKEGDNDDVNDGTMVERSTNFSTTDRTKALASTGMPPRLGITRDDIFTTSSTLQSLQIDTPQWKKVIDTKYNELMLSSNNNSNDDPAMIGPQNNKSFNTLKDLHLFENTMRYVGVPIIMKDSDGDIIGVWEKKVEDVKHSNGLKIVKEGSVEFVMKNESGG